MRQIFLVISSLIVLSSCKLAEPVGYNAIANGHGKPSILSPSQSMDRIEKTPEITPNYSKKQLEEERAVEVYDIFNINDNIRMMNKRSRNLYAFVDDWYGTPYRMGGKTRRGIDCSAFMQEIYGNIYKYQLPRTSREQFSITKKVNNQSDLREGDLVFFKIRTKDISHVGIYLADGKFAHASSSKGVIISSLEQEYWAKYYVGGGRVEEAIYALRND